MAEEKIEVQDPKPEVKPEVKPEIKPEVKPEPEFKPEVKPEFGPEIKPGDVPEPEVESKPEPEPETKPKPAVDINARIGRMYARLQQEREKRTSAEVSAKLATQRKQETEEGTESTTGYEDKALTRDDVEAIWGRKEKEKLFRSSETRVLQRHSDALNDDGSFNMNSEFTRRYIDIGKHNPTLAMMENGPELAEAMVEKEAGLSYKQGRKDEANRQSQVTGAHTGASTTTAVAGEKIVKLSPVQQKIATRMGMTHQQYADYQTKIDKGDKRVS